MKNIILPALFFLILTTSCKEKNDLINLTPDNFGVDTTAIDSMIPAASVPAAEERHVLLEDFTGVQCVNCPIAQEEAKKIAENNPGKVVIVSIHTSTLAEPYKESKYDFQTTDGDNLLPLLGSPQGLPIGAVDRKIYAGSNTPLVNYPQWNGYVNQQLALTTPVNLEIVSAKAENNTLAVRVRTIFTQDLDSAHFLSIMVTENNLIDMQLTPSGVDTYYVHNHALRKIFPAYNGVKLGESFEKGRFLERTYFATLDPSWNVDQLHVVALVHRRGNGVTRQEVIQVAEAEVE